MTLEQQAAAAYPPFGEIDENWMLRAAFIAGATAEREAGERFYEWLLMMNEPHHPDNPFTDYIILSDGLFYWSDDLDGDNSMDYAALRALWEVSLTENKQP